MESGNPGSAALGLRSSPGTPSALNMRRSMPAQKDGPAPRTTTTRTSSGIDAPMRARPRHMLGVIALRRSGRESVTVATLPEMLSSSPALARSVRSADTSPHCAASGLGLRLAPRRTAATAQRYTALTQDPVNEPVRPPSRRRQRADALAAAVSLLQVGRELRPVGTGHPGALLESLGHANLPGTDVAALPYLIHDHSFARDRLPGDAKKDQEFSGQRH